MSIESVMPSNHLILCHPLLPSVFPSIRVFSNESALLTRWPKYWSFSFSISPSNGYPGLISCRINGFDLLAVQRILYFVFWPCHMSCGIFIPQMIPARVLSIPWSIEVHQRPDRKFRQGFSGALLQLRWGGAGTQEHRTGQARGGWRSLFTWGGERCVGVRSQAWLRRPAGPLVVPSAGVHVQGTAFAPDTLVFCSQLFRNGSWVGFPLCVCVCVCLFLLVQNVSQLLHACSYV